MKVAQDPEAAKYADMVWPPTAKSGNLIVFILTSTLVPIVIKMMLDPKRKECFLKSLRSVIFWWSPYHTREIEHKEIEMAWGDRWVADNDLHNDVLIKAIQLYLHKERKLDYRDAGVVLQPPNEEDAEDDRPWEE